MNEFRIDILRSRHSVRSYKYGEVSESEARKLRAEATFINSHEAGLNFQVCVGDDGPFKGMARSYGMFHGVDNYLAVLIDPTFPHAFERAGYFAEQFVVEAVKLGLGTCFVGGTFSKAHVKCPVEVYEKIPFVVAFGNPDMAKTPLLARVTSSLIHRVKHSARDFFDGSDSEFEQAKKEFPWLDVALEAVACSPSALNSQPVRLAVGTVDGCRGIIAYTINPEKYAVELGIAKFNVAFAVGGSWDWGEKSIFYKE